MTKQRKHKKQIRERVARTGESYSTAKRQLEGNGTRGEPQKGSEDAYVYLGSSGINLVAWCLRHAVSVVDGLVELAAYARPLEQREPYECVGGALYGATKLATFGTYVEWGVNDRDTVLTGGWPTLKTQYMQGIDLAQNDTLSGEAVRALREQYGSELRAAGFAFNMHSWHREKASQVLEELLEFEPFVDAAHSEVRAAVAASFQKALRSAEALWLLTSSTSYRSRQQSAEARLRSPQTSSAANS